jgi:hypothetical protein
VTIENHALLEGALTDETHKMHGLPTTKVPWQMNAFPVQTDAIKTGGHP